MKSALRRSYATDKDAEITGVWVTLNNERNDDGTQPRFLIARAGGRNQNYRRVLERVTEPFRIEIQNKSLSPDEADRIEAQVCAEGVMVNWENVQDDNGVDIEFTRDNAIALFVELPDVRAELTLRANSLDTFRLARREAAAKN